MIKFGKSIMAAMWLLMLLSPVLFEAPFNWILLATGGFLLLLHAGQWAGVKRILVQHNVIKKNDAWQVLLFGFFAMWEIHQRLKKLSTETP